MRPVAYAMARTYLVRPEPEPVKSVARRFAEPAVRVLPDGLDAASRRPDSVALH